MATPEMTALIQRSFLARRNINEDSSARFCLAQAVKLNDEGALDSAKMWAVKSLAYSVGVFHADYKKVAAK